MKQIAIEEKQDPVEVTTIEVETPNRQKNRPQAWLQAAGCFQGNPDHEAHMNELAAERARQRETEWNEELLK